MLFKNDIPSQSFGSWLLKTRENRILLVLSTIAITIQIIWFKIWYPYPNFFPDSYEYIAGAIENRSIDYRPIGYTKFLQLFHFVTHSHLLLILVQYIVLQISILYLLFTISYMMQPGKWVFRVIVFCSILNPLVPNISNFVSSDPLFTALSLVWFTQLFWIIVRPKTTTLLFHALVLFLAFVLRYNALYYPVISIGVIVFANTRLRLKIISISLILLLIGEFVAFTKSQFRKLTDISQFTPFSGWQLVANAVVAYSHVEQQDPPESVPEEFRTLHAAINRYMDSLHRTPHDVIIETAPYYLWHENSPLLRYREAHSPPNYNPREFKTWSEMSPFFEDYGRYLIKKHPVTYFKYHILVNLGAYCHPYMEYLEMYNIGQDVILPVGIYWFQLKTNKTTTLDHNNDITITKYIPEINSIINLLLVLSLLGFLLLKGFNKCSYPINSMIGWALFVWLCNAGFSILAAPIVLRYQLFQWTITFVFVTLLIEFIVIKYRSLSTQQKLILHKPVIQ